MDEAPTTNMQARIHDTRAALASIETTLAALPEKKQQALGADDWEKSIAKIEEEESKLQKRREHLEQRIPLLEKQQEADAAQSAQLRIATLVDESAVLCEQENARLFISCCPQDNAAFSPTPNGGSGINSPEPLPSPLPSLLIRRIENENGATLECTLGCSWYGQCCGFYTGRDRLN